MKPLGPPADCPVAHDASPRSANAAASAAVGLPPAGDTMRI